MNEIPDDLYELLPAVYRLRDAEQKEVLRALLRVIGEQAQAVQENISQLYEDQFIETCRTWVVPYLGQLVGVRRAAPEAGEETEDLDRARDRHRQLHPRREVAHAVEHARRKGTVSVLEDLADTVAALPARAVEFWSLVHQLLPARGSSPSNARSDVLGRMPDLRNKDELDRINGPFDEVGHLVDPRRLRSSGLAGRHNLPHVGVFVWRLVLMPLAQVDAYCQGPYPPANPLITLYRVNPLGISGPMFVRPVREEQRTDVAQEWNVPAPLRTEALKDRGEDPPHAHGRYYGREGSLALWIPNLHGAAPDGFVPCQAVLPMDLGAFCSAGDDARISEKRGELAVWLKELLSNHRVAVDPENGLLAIASTCCTDDPTDVRVSYHTAFSSEMGGGQYPRRRIRPYQPGTSRAYVSRSQSERDGEAPDSRILDAELAALLTAEDVLGPECRDQVLEIFDSRTYALSQGVVSLDKGQRFEIRAARGCRPVVRLDSDPCEPGFTFRLAPASTLVLDGLVVAGAPLRLESWSGSPDREFGEGKCGTDLPIDNGHPGARVIFRHCTLAPRSESCGRHAELQVDLAGGCVVVEKSVASALQACPSGCDKAEPSEPTKLVITDSIVDALDSILDSLIDTFASSVASNGGRGAAESPGAGVPRKVSIAGARFDLTAERSTLLGSVWARRIDLAQDAIFNDTVTVIRRDEGAMRFCYVPPNLPDAASPAWNTPTLYYCQPAMALERSQRRSHCRRDEAAGMPEEASLQDGQTICAETVESLEKGWQDIKPRFTSTLFGEPAYCQLAHDCPDEIRRGAEDESEMGAFHELYQPQRETNLNRRLRDFTPASMETALIYAN